MKRSLSLLLAALFCIGALMLASCGGTTDPTPTPAASTPDKATESKKTETPTPDKQTEQPSEPSESETPTEIEIEDISDKLFSSIKRTTKTYEHKAMETVPDSFTLVGTEFLPAVYDRGPDLKGDAADAVTYMQYTNAVARYEKSVNPASTWKPAKDFNSCFSSKFTGQYSAKYLWGIYDVLRDNGCLTNAQDDYKRNSLGLPIITESGKYNAKTTGWLVDEGLGDTAYQYRLRGYEIVDTGDTQNIVESKGYYDTHTRGIRITDSENGQKFLTKVKEAVASGNVVVARGTYQTWQYEQFPEASASAKAGDTVIAYSLKLSDADAKEAFSYHLCIVGYDDKISYTTHEVTTEGAFLVCNPGDPSWGKNGYAWLMYDAMNTYCPQKTEDGKDAFKLDEDQTRVATVSYYTFIYWDSDITTEKPTLYAEVELETANRNAFTFFMTKTDAFGRNSQIEAYQTCHAINKRAETYGLDPDDTTQYFNPTGTLKGKSVKGYYTISFERLLTTMPENTTYEDFTLGLRVKSTDANSPVTIKSIKFKNSNGEVIKTVTLPKNTTIANSEINFRINLGKPVTPDVIVGNFYTFKSVATGAYLLKTKNLPTITLGDYNAKNLCWFHITYNSEKDLYKLQWKEGTSKYVSPLDIDKNEPRDGSQIFASPKDSVTREATQFWHISYNSDGTFSLYLKNEKNELFAMSCKEGDKVPILRQITEVTDDIKWELVTDYDGTYKNPHRATAERDGNKLHITASDVTAKADKVTIKVYGINGKSDLASTEAEIKDGKFEADITVDNLPDEYLIVFTHEETVDEKTVTKYTVSNILNITF